MSHLYKVPMQFSSVCRIFDPHLLRKTINYMTLNTFLLSVLVSDHFRLKTRHRRVLLFGESFAENSARYLC